MSIKLDFTPPFDPGIFDFLAARAVTGVEEADSLCYARTVLLDGGHGWLRVSWDGQALWLEQDLEDPADAAQLLGKVRHLFNLDHIPH
ncbi:AlkA N-terminal domain-containing protein [Arthrobacter sp. TMP15]|uniref:AlkA N-terminal domain-containing protein n=1 Tax=Arthrobacter sp. TMP15 TaxID=3140789 RepID=UPI0031BB4DDC